MHDRISLAAALVLLAGCAAAPAGGGTAAAFLCGGTQAHAQFNGERLTLRVGGTTYHLTQAVSASGARYTGNSNDGAVTFWNKGRTATLTIGDREYPDCVDAAAPRLAGDWTVTSLDGMAVADPALATLSFDDVGRVAGRAFCNRFTSSYRITGNAIAFTGGAATRMACLPPLMEQEAALLRLLEDAVHYTLDRHTLTLTTGDGRTLTARRD